MSDKNKRKTEGIEGKDQPEPKPSDAPAEAQLSEAEQLKAELAALKAELAAAKTTDKSPSHPAAIAVGTEWFKVQNDGILIPDSDGKLITGLVSREEMIQAGVQSATIDKLFSRGVLVTPDFTEGKGWLSDGRPRPDSLPLIDGEKVPVGQHGIGMLQRVHPGVTGVYA